MSHKFLDSSFLFSFTSLFSLFYLSLSFGSGSGNNKIINENKEGKIERKIKEKDKDKDKDKDSQRATNQFLEEDGVYSGAAGEMMKVV